MRNREVIAGFAISPCLVLGHLLDPGREDRVLQPLHAETLDPRYVQRTDSLAGDNIQSYTKVIESHKPEIRWQIIRICTYEIIVSPRIRSIKQKYASL